MNKENLNEVFDSLNIFPCKHNSKEPATPNGYKDAKTNFDVIEVISEGKNVGLALSKTNLICLDCDVDNERGLHGDETLKKLENKLGKLPKTLTQSTPRGGKHYIFDDKGITNPIGKIGKDIDVKYNGYILLAPSKINGKSYKIIHGLENDNLFVASLPENWLNYINKPQHIKNNYNKIKYTQKKFDNVDIDKVFQECRFLTYCKENADILSEPMWHSMITVLVQLPDAGDLIHDLSSPYPKYNFYETEQKIKCAKKFGHSQTCEYISSTYPDVCTGCNFAIKI